MRIAAAWVHLARSKKTREKLLKIRCLSHIYLRGECFKILYQVLLPFLVGVNWFLEMEAKLPPSRSPRLRYLTTVTSP